MDTFNFHAGNNFANRGHKRCPWEPFFLLQGKQWLQTVAVNLQSCCLWNGYFEGWDPVCNHSQPAAIFTATLMHQDGNKMAKTATRWSQSVIEWGQVDNWMQSVWDNMSVYYGNITNLLLSIYTEITLTSCIQIWNKNSEFPPQTAMSLLQDCSICNIVTWQPCFI